MFDLDGEFCQLSAVIETPTYLLGSSLLGPPLLACTLLMQKPIQNPDKIAMIGLSCLRDEQCYAHQINHYQMDSIRDVNVRLEEGKSSIFHCKPKSFLDFDF